MRAVSGAETEESIVFVMESNGGELVLTSLPGNTLASDGITQIVATESNVTFIRETAQLLLDMSPDAASMQFAVPNVNPFLYKGYWVEVKTYSSIGGITLQSPWLAYRGVRGNLLFQRRGQFARRKHRGRKLPGD